MPRHKIVPAPGKFCPSCGSETMRDDKDTAQSGRSRWRCQTCKARTTKPLNEKPQALPKFKKELKKVYIVTQAVNDTPIVSGFFDTLKFMAKKLDAQLVVVGGVYKNPDMIKQGFLSTLSWPEEVLPYFCQDDFKINKHLIIRAGTRIEHTAINPLGGMNHSAGTCSEIFAHPQLSMEMVATPKNEVPKMLHTTGTISQKNYGGSTKAKKAQFHHNNSALLIEVVGSRFWVRPISWDGAGVDDLLTRYEPNKAYKHGIKGLVFGDLHIDKMNAEERAAVLGLSVALNPEVNVLHDVLDMHTGSHHKEGNILYNLRSPDFDITKELNRTCNFLRAFKSKCLMVGSNHHDHLDQWFNRLNVKHEQVNLGLYYRLGELARLHKGSLFELVCTHIFPLPNVEFLTPNKAYDVCGIDVAQHGHKGPNGAKGSGKAFAKTGRKTITAHSHSPAINKGNWVVGTAAMGQEYATGYSSWMEAHAVIYKNGKRTFIFRIKGKFSPMVSELLK